MIRCTGRGVELTSGSRVRESTAWASAECLSANDEVLAYTLSLGDGFFSPQLAVDAYAASHALGRPSPITAAFALIGLCLYVEQGFSGRRVQLAHTQLGERRREWPRFEGPAEGAATSVLDVLAAPPGVERDERIRAWAWAWAWARACGERGVPSTSACASSCSGWMSRGYRGGSSDLDDRSRSPDPPGEDGV